MPKLCNMSRKHLAKGSVEPPRTEGILRLYSMEYCPYAQRPRLVLKAKGIPFETVNINLTEKPEWYFKIHPEGKVPALLDNGKITIESLDISDYLDEKYPQNPLYSSDPKIKQHEKELIQKIAPVVSGFYSFLLNNQEHATEEQISELLAPLQPFEEELSKKGGKFFGGDKPNMVDYMFWPWAERSEATVRKSKGQNLLTDDKIPNLQKWKKAMKEDRAVSEIYHSPEEHWKVFEYRIYKTPLDYDTL